MAALASGLETRNHLRKRQEKNEFYFQLREEIFLTEKMKRACRRESNKQCVEQNFRKPAATDFESPHERFPANSLRIPS